jgi:hypothetical protein
LGGVGNLAGSGRDPEPQTEDGSQGGESNHIVKYDCRHAVKHVLMILLQSPVAGLLVFQVTEFSHSPNTQAATYKTIEILSTSWEQTRKIFQGEGGNRNPLDNGKL